MIQKNFKRSLLFRFCLFKSHLYIYIQMKRKKVAIFIDNSIRTVPFSSCYDDFKKSLFNKLENELEIEDKEQIRSFWDKELEQPEIEEFYLKQKPNEDDLLNKDWSIFFYNKKHYLTFLEEFSFNLFVDADVPNKKDIDIINIMQQYLVDIVLVDEVTNNRKKQNTLFFLSKVRVYPSSILFLENENKLDEGEYFAIWNPKENTEQENGKDLGMFEVWAKELELKLKEVNV